VLCLSSSPEQSAAASTSRGRGLSGASSGSVSKRASSSASSSRRALGDITNKDREPAASAQLKKERTASAKQVAAALPFSASSATAASSSSSSPPLPCPDIEHTLGLTFAEQCALETEGESGWVQDGELTTAECQAVVRQLTSQASMKRMFETEDDRCLPCPSIDTEQERDEEAADAADLQQVERLQLELNLNFDLGF
jgi:hypothetical protein